MAPEYFPDREPRFSRAFSYILNGILIWIQYRPRTVIGVIIGLIEGLLFHWLGFVDTLLVNLFMVIGFFVGKYLDERKEVGQILDRLFSSDQ